MLAVVRLGSKEYAVTIRHEIKTDRQTPIARRRVHDA